MTDKLRILYAEDNEMSDDMLEGRLIGQGFHIIRARDGQQAIDTAHSELPDLILMDTTLPIKNGWQASKEIKTSEDTKHIPIITLTTYVMAGKEKILITICDDTQTKPIHLPSLLEKMNRLLTR